MEVTKALHAQMALLNASVDLGKDGTEGLGAQETHQKGQCDKDESLKLKAT